MKGYDIGDKKVILYVGRISKRKGIDKLVLAFNELVKEKEDVHLVIAGRDYGYLLARN